MYEESDEDVGDESSRGIRHKAGSYSAPLDAYRVLVVAGDEELIALTRLSLAKNGLEVKAATTAYGALAKLEDSAHDLVILDTVLPDLSGWEVLRRIRGSSEVPVMLLTKRNSDVDKARGLDLGADDYLTKPFSFLEFEARVRALLRRARIANPHQEDSAASFTPAAEGPTVAIIVERRHLGDRALVQARSALESAGCHVPLVVPDANHAFDIPSEAPPWDAVLSRGRDLAGLGMLAAVSALVVKPFDGDGSAGLALLTRPGDVDLLPDLEGKQSVYLAQELLQTDGWDLKLYGIGNRVWAVRKPSPVSFLEPGAADVGIVPKRAADLVKIDARLRDIALTCGRACGLELWGVDVAMTSRGPYVIEVNDFPTYSAVPDAGAAIAQHVLALIRINTAAQEMGCERMLSIVRSQS